MNHDDLRLRIGRALSDLGVSGHRDTTDPLRRPRWRASFSSHGVVEGETRYLQLFVPVDDDILQLNCTVEASVLDAMPQEQLQGSLEEFGVQCGHGTRQWESLLADLGVDPGDTDGWSATIALHTGIYHRMVLTRVTMPLEHLSDRSIELATRIGYRLSGDARARMATRCEAS
ncbi:MAG TPA: hypothetical protein VHS06_00880 [Chloroflexota bacterium]|nr:hypothetical protein [Chloroflexota bacterium]